MKILLTILMSVTLLLAENPITKAWYIETVEERGKYVFNIDNDTISFCNHINYARRFPSEKSALKYLKKNFWSYKDGDKFKGFHFRLDYVWFVEPGKKE